MAKETKVTESSGNVFADLGVEKPEELKLKAEVASAINSIIKHRGLKQKDTAKILAITQPQVSALTRGELYRFSVERLFHLLNALGRDVNIVIKKKSPRTKRATRIQVIAA